MPCGTTRWGNAIAQSLAPLSDPVTGLTFPDFNNPANQHNAGLSAADEAAGSQMFQTNLILPEPSTFSGSTYPPVRLSGRRYRRTADR